MSEILCVDLGGTNCRLAVFKANKLIQKNSFLCPESHTEFQENFLEVLKAFKTKSFKEISIAAAGIWNKELMLKQSINLKNYIDKDIWTKIKIDLNSEKILIHSDVEAAAIGEAIYGREDKYENLLYLNLGTGTSAALFKDHKIFKTNYSPVLRLDYLPKETNLNDIDHLSKQLISLSLILSPELIVIGGGKSNNWSSYIEPAITKAKAYLKDKLTYEINFDKAKLEDAALYGALELAKIA